jgi:hypothetical protein
MVAGKPFEASKYLSDLNGRDYLEVKWRLLWLRTEHPDASIETELVKHGGGLALFRARVSVLGGGTATGWGSETADDFGDFIEKAETKALGRALAALGFGTQFCEDFDFSARSQKRERRAAAAPPRRTAGPPGERPLSAPPVVDSPVARSELKVVRERPDTEATPSQLKAIYAIGRDLPHVGDGDIESRSRALFGRPPNQLSKRQASEFIDLLRRPAGAVNIPPAASTG